MVIIATKVDKLSKIEAEKALAYLRNTYHSLSMKAAAELDQQDGYDSSDGDPGGDALGNNAVPVIMFSSVTGLGKSEVWKSVRDNMLHSH